MLSHDCRFFEVPFELLKTLDPPIGNVTSFLRVKHGPLPSMKLTIEVQDEEVMHKIHKSVPNISLVFVVDRDIEKVVLALVVFVNLLKKKSLIIFVGNVLDHDSRASILATLNLLDVNVVHSLVSACLRRLRVSVLNALVRLLDPST